jgi:hypothetical protein
LSDLGDQVFAAHDIGTSFLSLGFFGRSDDGRDAFGFTDGVREDDGGTNLLFSLFDVDS